MPLRLLILELIGLIVGASYLWFKHRQRARNWTAREDAQKWTGHGIEVGTLRPRVEQMRHDYLAERQVARGAWFHRSLLEMARRTVMQLGYFRQRETEQDPHKYGP